MNPLRKLLRHLRWMGSIPPLLVLGGADASAEPALSAERVILLQPTTASNATRRSLARIRDELSADRFQVVLADSGATDDPGAVIERLEHDTDGDAILAVFGDPTAGQAELCVVQRVGWRTAVRQAIVVADDPERMPEALATRALELLRATALELSIAIDHSTPASRESPEHVLETSIPSSPSPRAREASFVSVDMGLGVWKSVDGPPPAVTPVGRVGFRLSDRILARISLAGLGSRPSIQTAHGSGTLSQAMALVELVLAASLEHRVRPTLSLGAGVLKVGVTGSGVAPYQGLAPEQWSAALDGGAGVGFALSSHLAVMTELHAILASPHPVVHFGDTRAATIGYPSLMFTLSLHVEP